jgi:hypothetical protein
MGLKTNAVLFLIVPWILLLACTDESQKSKPLSTRDFIMQDFFKAIRSSPDIDTTREEFILLKAYYENDTASLRKLHRETIDGLKSRNEILDSIACKAPLPLHSLGYEEAYRFRYGIAFCDTSVIITVGKSKSGITLHMILYRTNRRTEKCDVIRQFEKKLDEKTWIKLRDGVDFADFWALRATNDEFGYDGSSLHVYGYERPVSAFTGRHKGIYRWAPEETAIGILFKDVLDMSVVRVKCFRHDERYR